MVGNRGIDGEWVIWRMGLMGLDVASGDRGSAKKRLMEGEGWMDICWGWDFGGRIIDWGRDEVGQGSRLSLT